MAEGFLLSRALLRFEEADENVVGDLSAAARIFLFNDALYQDAGSASFFSLC